MTDVNRYNMLTCDVSDDMMGPFEKFHAEGTLIKAIPTVYVDTNDTKDNKLFVNGRVVATKFQGRSDRRLKENLRSVKNSLETINKLNSKWFNFIDEKTPTCGYIAQDVQQILPSLVDKDRQGYLSVAYIEIIPILSEAIKELTARVENLESYFA
jgi:hypothetical protein